jgi:tellurite resistance-related uncharacterized protein
MTTTLPAGVRSYKRTATFTEATTPAALMNDHATKEGVWGLIHVEEGRLRYLVTVKRRSKGTPDRRRRGTPFLDMMLVC